MKKLIVLICLITFIGEANAQTQCWDTNGNGLCDPNLCEDLNADGLCDTLDCIINTTCTASFTWSIVNGKVHFINTSVYPPCNYGTTKWDLGDGTIINSGVAPIHQYTSPGAYIVKLERQDTSGACFDVMCDTIFWGSGYCWDLDNDKQCDLAFEDLNNDGICDSTDCLIGNNCQAYFEATSLPVACAPTILNNYSRTSNAYSSSWDFGDGNSSTLESPHHNWPRLGLKYNCCLTIVDSVNNCSSTYCDSITTPDNCWDINCDGIQDPCEDANGDNLWNTDDCNIIVPCKADFNYTNTGFKSVQFNNNATFGTACKPLNTRYFWTFNNGSQSQLLSPNHTFQTDGIQTVCLEIFATNCYDSICKTISVSPPGSCEAIFTYSLNNRVLKLQNNSAASRNASYIWDFGNGSTSISRDPVYTYPVNGIYTVTLMMEDKTNNCRDTTSHKVSFNVGLEEQLNFKDLNIYPNPAKDIVSIKLKSNNKDLITVRLYDMLGKELISKQFQTDLGNFEGQLDLSELPSGSYILETRQGNLRSNKNLLIKKE